MMGLKPARNLRAGIQYGFANIIFIGHDSAAVIQLHLLAEEAAQVGTASLLVGTMAGGACQLLEELLPIGRQGAGRRRLR